MEMFAAALNQLQTAGGVRIQVYRARTMGPA